MNFEEQRLLNPCLVRADLLIFKVLPLLYLPPGLINSEVGLLGVLYKNSPLYHYAEES